MVEPLEGNKVKVSVEVDEAEFDKAIDSAFKKIAHEVRLPGFRPGKAPRRVLEARIGIAPAREQALRDAIPQYLARAVSENDVDIIAPPEVDITAGESDGPVAFDAVSAGRARQTGVVIIDTAGRLPTQLHLMEELRKIRRVLAKAMDGAPHESLLVLDGNTGQNMLAQVKAFDDAVALTGLIVTKLDGTAKGGALAALAHTRRDRPIPVYFIGVGEGIDDLQAFSAAEFASALLD